MSKLSNTCIGSTPIYTQQWIQSGDCGRTYDFRGRCQCEPGRTGEDCSAYSFCTDAVLSATNVLNIHETACEPTTNGNANPDVKSNVRILSTQARDLQGDGMPAPKGSGTGPIFERLSLMAEPNTCLVQKGGINVHCAGAALNAGTCEIASALAKDVVVSNSCRSPCAICNFIDESFLGTVRTYNCEFG